jgi:hypothetical protein
MRVPGRSRWPVMLLAGGILAGMCAPARAGTQFGVRAGYCDLKGEVFHGSGKPGGVPLFGAQAIFSLLPAVGLCLSGEAKNETLRFDQAANLDQLFRGEGQWRDLSLAAALQARILPIGVGPFGLYVGGGGGVHFADVKMKNAQIVPAKADPPAGGTVLASGDPVNDFIHQVEKNHSDFSWHLLAGGSVSLPLFPLSVFVEGRFEDVSSDFSPHGYSIYAGLNLSLD